MTPRPKVRILCFGDSLTSGYFCHGLRSHPYSHKLEELLGKALPHLEVKVVTSGVPGDVATFESFSHRLRDEYEKHHYFNWVIILAGTNDLAYRIPPEKIFASLKATWDIALSKGGKVLALTVPEREAKPEPLIKAQKELNDNIKSHKQYDHYVFDLEAHIPFHSLSEQDREKYWGDGLHLREEGYDWMGEKIFGALMPLINQTNSSPSLVGEPVEEITEQDLLDEEAGNPKKLNEGYIVVRKRDLN